MAPHLLAARRLLLGGGDANAVGNGTEPRADVCSEGGEGGGDGNNQRRGDDAVLQGGHALTVTAQLTDHGGDSDHGVIIFLMVGHNSELTLPIS